MSITKTEFGVYRYDSGNRVYSREEADTLNREYYRKEDEAVEKSVKPAGFIRIPVFYDDGDELEELSFYVHPDFEPSCTVGYRERHTNRYNIYIPSYNRAGMKLTAYNLSELFHMDNWYLAIDPTQFDEYSKHYSLKHLIVREPRFKSVKRFNIGATGQTPDYTHGTTGIYNSLLYFSRSLGEDKFWTMDDDFVCMAMKAAIGDKKIADDLPYDKMRYYRCSKLLEKYGFSMKEFLRDIEDLSLKVRNHGFVGLEKFGQVFNSPVEWRLGTRVYSFYLTNNRTLIDHFGTQNNDVITSMELSKLGFVNMLLEGITYNSMDTQAGGGLTETYQEFGTLEKGKCLVRTQPNYAKISYRFNRIHHTVDYSKLKRQRLVGAVRDS